MKISRWPFFYRGFFSGIKKTTLYMTCFTGGIGGAVCCFLGPVILICAIPGFLLGIVFGFIIGLINGTIDALTRYSVIYSNECVNKEIQKMPDTVFTDYTETVLMNYRLKKSMGFFKRSLSSKTIMETLENPELRVSQKKLALGAYINDDKNHGKLFYQSIGEHLPLTSREAKNTFFLGILHPTSNSQSLNLLRPRGQDNPDSMGSEALLQEISKYIGSTCSP